MKEADFIYLMQKAELTKGNLSSHLSKVEQDGYVEIRKEFIEKIPGTVIILTSNGRKAYDRYRETMKNWLNAME